MVIKRDSFKIDVNKEKTVKSIKECLSKYDIDKNTIENISDVVFDVLLYVGTDNPYYDVFLKEIVKKGNPRQKYIDIDVNTLKLIISILLQNDVNLQWIEDNKDHEAYIMNAIHKPTIEEYFKKNNDLTMDNLKSDIMDLFNILKNHYKFDLSEFIIRIEGYFDYLVEYNEKYSKEYMLEDILLFGIPMSNKDVEYLYNKYTSFTPKHIKKFIQKRNVSFSNTIKDIRSQYDYKP